MLRIHAHHLCHVWTFGNLFIGRITGMNRSAVPPDRPTGQLTGQRTRLRQQDGVGPGAFPALRCGAGSMSIEVAPRMRSSGVRFLIMVLRRFEQWLLPRPTWPIANSGRLPGTVPCRLGPDESADHSRVSCVRGADDLTIMGDSSGTFAWIDRSGGAPMAGEFGELGGHDAYEVLGVEPSASHQEIRRSYHELVKANHPDRLFDESGKVAAEERIRLINAAYEILESRREAYDAFRVEPAERVDDPWGQAQPGTADPWTAASPVAKHRPMPLPPLYRQAPPSAFVKWDPAEHQRGLIAAGELFRHMVTGGSLDPLGATPVILQPGEYAFADLSLEYSRLYGMDVTYENRTVIPFGSPAFVIGALAANAVGNAVTRSRARAQAATTWRERQIAAVMLTSERLSIGTHGGRLSFWHGGLAEFLPAPDAFTLELIFHDTTPLMLRGPGAPWLSVAMARLLYPPSELLRIPGFAGMTAWFRKFGQ